MVQAVPPEGALEAHAESRALRCDPARCYEVSHFSIECAEFRSAKSKSVASFTWWELALIWFFALVIGCYFCCERWAAFT